MKAIYLEVLSEHPLQLPASFLRRRSGNTLLWYLGEEMRGVYRRKWRKCVKNLPFALLLDLWKTSARV